MRKLFLALALAGGLTAVLACPVRAAEAPKAGHDHAEEIDAYEGTKTCLECHEESGAEVAASLHYQHMGPAPNIKDWEPGRPAGMMISF